MQKNKRRRDMKVRLVLVMAVLVLASGVCSGKVFAAEGQDAVKEAVSESSILYVCNCGADCKCNTVSLSPGKCECGEDLVPMHILKIAENKAILCVCGKDCTCKLDQADPSKCGCGKAVKQVDLKGMYVCNCGADCACNIVSDKPGKCKCGNELKKVAE
jgi:hypothetical protein